jgi:alpha/beta superfamily hydrolase
MFITAGWLKVDGVNCLIGDFQRVGMSDGVFVGGVEEIDCGCCVQLGFLCNTTNRAIAASKMAP